MSSPTIEVIIDAEISRLTSAIEQTEDKLQSLGKNLTNIGKALTVGLTAPIVALGVASIKTFGDLEALKKGLIAVSGSAEDAEKEFTKLIEVAKLPGLGLQEATRGSVALQSAGFSADQAREALLAFGNALATVGKGKQELNFVILALTQLQNKTTGFGQDLRQLVEQLPQLRGALTNAFGTAESEEIAKLGVTGKEVVETLVQEFAKLPKVTGGIKNAFENLSDSTAISFARIGESINKAFNVEGLIEKLGSVIDSISLAFSELDESTQVMIITFAGLAAAIGPLLLAIGGIITALPVITAGFVALSGPIGLVSLAVAAVIPLLFKLNSELNRTKEIAGLVKADLLAESLQASREEVDRLAKSLEKTGLTRLEAQNRAIDLLLKQELNLLRARDENKDIDFEAIKARVTALNNLKATLNKVTESTTLSFEEWEKLANAKNEEVFRNWALAADKFNASIAETIRLQKSIASVSESIASEPKKNPVSGVFEFGNMGITEAPITEFVDTLEEVKPKLIDGANQIGNVFINLGSTIGEALSGANGSFKNFGNALLKTIGGIAVSLGQAAIGIGTSMLAIKFAFKNPFTAIAAGIALVALGSALGSIANNATSGIGGGGSVGSGSAGQSYTGSGLEAMNSLNLTGEFKVKGADLIYVISQEEKKRIKG